MKYILVVSALLVSVLYVDAQTRLFVEPEFSAIAKDHKTIAILPFKTEVSLRPRQMESLGKGDLEKIEQDESASIQRSLYSWFLKRRQQGKLWVEVQDLRTTNSLLAKNGLDYYNLHEATLTELADILGVDAVVDGNFATNKPMSEGAGVALGVLFGVWGPTNNATMNLFIHNGADGKVLVNYNKGVSGSVGSTTDQLINIIMRKVSRRIPYSKRK